jgi:hypothetical protein
LTALQGRTDKARMSRVPWDFHAGQRIIGACLMTDYARNRPLGLLDESYVLYPLHALVFQAFIDTRESRRDQLNKPLHADRPAPGYFISLIRLGSDDCFDWYCDVLTLWDARDKRGSANAV